MSNTIWILANKDDRDYDHCNDMVVVAATPERARYIAASHAMDEGKDVWLDPARSSCEPVDASAEGLVVRDVSWG